MKPTFIGLGGQKCASSWIYLILRNHPDAFVASPKELDFFSWHYERGTQWYESNFDAAVGRKAVGEISPSYMPDWNAPSRARDYRSDLRLVVALRDPVERAYSNHLHNVRLAFHKGDDLTFESGLSSNPMYVEQSLYAKHLRRWLEFFPKDQMLVLLQEDMESSPADQARRVYEFLGINTAHVSTAIRTRANVSYMPRSRSRELFVRKSGALLRRMGLGWLERPMRSAGLIAALHGDSRLQIREIVPPMREDTRRKLYAEFGSHTIELAGMLGRDSLPWRTWEYATAAAHDPHVSYRG